MRSQWLLGVAAVVVVIAIVLGARFAQHPRTVSDVAGSDEASTVPTDVALSESAIEPEGSDDALCATYVRSKANSDADGAADNPPVEDPFMTAARQRLLASQSAENLISVALIAHNDDTQRMRAITQAMSTGRQNAVVVWSAVQMCDRPAENLTCPTQDWENELVKLDSENSEVWIRLAASTYERGDTAKALDALRRASTAAESSDYWPETAAMLERAFDSAGGYSFPQRAALALRYAASALPAFSLYVSMCSKQSKVDAEWAQTCLDYGRLVERQGKTEIGIGIARSIQFAALEAMGDTGAAEEVEARKAQASRNQEAAAAFDGSFIFMTPRLFAEYLAAIREHGERAAVVQLNSELNRAARQCSQQSAN